VYAEARGEGGPEREAAPTELEHVGLTVPELTGRAEHAGGGM
jgi:hypothetical protein